ncbi:exoenzyme S [Pseudomonas aeruginosa]|nr:exoenzyme S [Pseudomonas aeruginosa]
MHDGCLLLMFLRQSRNGKPHRPSGLAAVFSLESAAAKPKKREPRLTVSPGWHCSNGCLQ